MEKVEKGLAKGFFYFKIAENSVEIWESFYRAVLRIFVAFEINEVFYPTGFAGLFTFFCFMIISEVDPANKKEICANP